VSAATPLIVQFNHRPQQRQQVDESFRLEVDLALPASGITGVFGPSGSGKTTLLRGIAGLLPLSSAHIRLGETCWQDQDTLIAAYKRRIGYVFQEASLFPHLNVAGNLHYARKRAVNPQLDESRILQLLGLEHLLQRRADELSGGERQRVAVARALFSSPSLLLMDEPLAALDYRRKSEILPYLLDLKSELQIPILYVSHTADELASLADWLVVLDEGKVQSSGPIEENFHMIAEAAHGDSDLAVLIQGTISALEPEWHLQQVQFPGGQLLVRDSGRPVGDNIRLRVQARDVSISLLPPEQTSILNNLPAEIESIESNADSSMVLVTAWVKTDTKRTRFMANITRRSAVALSLTVGQQVYLLLKSVAILN
jgi:molybdate transport system ATP-binding protein